VSDIIAPSTLLRRSLPLHAAPSTAQRVAGLSRELAQLNDTAARSYFAIDGDAHPIKSTVSLCAECLGHVPALVFSQRGKVFVRSRCTEHGHRDGLLENDSRYYFVSTKDRAGRLYDPSRVFHIPEYTLPGQDSCCEGGACDGADQMGNKTCTILVEVTNACNLACTVCYSDARGDRVVPRAELERMVDDLARKKGGLDSVQLTGGEALLHPEFFELVQHLYDNPLIKKIYLPTNGIELSDPAVARKLLPFQGKLLVLLQFDGVEDQSDRTLRQATPGRLRQRVIDNMGELGIFMQLTMTLAHGVNDSQVGAVLAIALEHEHIKVLALQPATYSGRYGLAPDALERLTLSDMVKAVVNQASVRVTEADFVPIPCSHPNCGWITLFVRRFGMVHNVVRYVDLPKVIDAVSYKTQLSTSELQTAIGSREPFSIKRLVGDAARRLVRSQDMFTIAIKPFMDRFSYDHDRIANCCHHLMDTHGVPTSFCEYNARLRQTDSWQRFPTLESARAGL
jgi:uncharacterized radical SAM superfamily Fe-S cluster-containing enzyme